MKPKWVGRLEYGASMKIQAEMLLARHETILGFEYGPTITLGKRASESLDLKASQGTLRSRGIEVVVVDRGGHATLHNLGQLVIYPIVDLRARNLGVRDYLCLLQKTTQAVLKRFDIEAVNGEEPGLYTAKGKIAFFGVRIMKGWTSHGVSINVANDLADFSLIRSCGKATEQFAKMADFGAQAPLVGVFSQWCLAFNSEMNRVAGPSKEIEGVSSAPGLTPNMNPLMLEKPFRLRV